jgi:galacturan 1,4-alpha-galacturonidase
MKVSNVLTQAIGLTLSLTAAVEASGSSRSGACHPHQPFHPLPPSQVRHRTCHVPSHGDGTDDSANILSTLRKCNNGGKVVFDADKTYTVGKAMDMTFLKHVDLGMRRYKPQNGSSPSDILANL